MRSKQTKKSKTSYFSRFSTQDTGLGQTEARMQMDGILKRINRPTKVFMVSLGIVLLLGLMMWGFVRMKFLAPVNAGDKSVIEVEIPRGSGVNTIGRILEENGIIRNKTAFKLFVDLYDRGSKLRSGSKPYLALHHASQHALHAEAFRDTGYLQRIVYPAAFHQLDVQEIDCIHLQKPHRILR